MSHACMVTTARQIAFEFTCHHFRVQVVGMRARDCMKPIAADHVHWSAGTSHP